ncbi:MAG: proline dehydrogenase family protein [Oligoflexia bacterium]|nr:proline dehydrogenase family protein [Oligoflexia bacterium]
MNTPEQQETSDVDQKIETPNAIQNDEKIGITLPRLLKKNITLYQEKYQENWSVSFWDDFVNILLKSDDTFNDDSISNISSYVNIFKHYISRLSDIVKDNHFFRSIIINNTPFTLIIFLKNKEIYLLSHNMRFELLLDEELEKIGVSAGHTNTTTNTATTITTTNKISDVLNDALQNFQVIKKIIGIVKLTDINKLPSEIEISTYTHNLPYLNTSAILSSDHENEESQNLYEKIGHKKFLEIDKNFVDSLSKLIETIRLYKRPLFEKISDHYLNILAKYAIIRVNLLTFVSTLPSLNKDNDPSAKELKHLLLETIKKILQDSADAFKAEIVGEYGPISKWHKILATIAQPLTYFAPSSMVSLFTRKTVEIFSKRFLSAKNIEDTTSVIKNLHHLDSNRNATFDILGELSLTEKDAEKYLENVLKLIDKLAQIYSTSENQDKVHHTTAGAEATSRSGIPQANISIKMTALASNFNPYSFNELYQKIAPRLEQILLKAHQKNVFVNIDAEHFVFREITFEIYKKLLLENASLININNTGLVVQAYLKDAASYVNKILLLAKARKITIPIRLVKGAYWDHEVHAAANSGLDSPVFLNKFETDINFRQLAFTILREGKEGHLQLCIGSHNFIDHVFAEVIRLELFPHSLPIEHQTLYKTSESLAQTMSKMKWIVRDYVTIGNTITGLGYFVRRIVENSSQTGFLTHIRDQLLATKDLNLNEIKQSNGINNILNIIDQVQQAQKQNEYTCSAMYTITTNYSKTPPISLTLNDNFKSLSDQIRIFSSINTTTNTTTTTSSTITNFDHDITSVDWEKLPPLIRYLLLIKVQNSLLCKKQHFINLIIHQGNKILSTAAREIDLAINYTNYFLLHYKTLSEQNSELRPHGKILIIIEEQFPFSSIFLHLIPALLTANRVIIKCDKENYYVIKQILELFYCAGLPVEIISLSMNVEYINTANILNHWATDITSFSANNHVSAISYQGNMDAIIELKRKIDNYNNPTYNYGTKIKPKDYNPNKGNSKNTVVAATAAVANVTTIASIAPSPIKLLTRNGGKNGVIITPTANINKALKEVLFWAYSNSGMRSASLGKIIIHNSQKKSFTAKLVEMLDDIPFKHPSEFSTILTEFNNPNQKDQIIKFGKMLREETIRLKGQILYEKEKFIPLLIELPYWDALKNCLFIKKEILGPFVHLVGYDNISEAIELFNAVPTGIIGALYSENRYEIDQFLKNTKVRGNSYINPTFSYSEGVSAIEWIEKPRIDGEKFLLDFCS